MMLFLIIGALAGVLLGLRFKVLILIPFILIIACAIVATGDGPKAITLTILATAVLIQIGYVLGLVVCFCVGWYLSKPKARAYQPSFRTSPTRSRISSAREFFLRRRAGRSRPAPGSQVEASEFLSYRQFLIGEPVKAICAIGSLLV